MGTIDDGGPAIPCNFNMSTFEHEFKGISLRDYFAAKAMASEIQLDTVLAISRIKELMNGAKPKPEDSVKRIDRVAENAYRFADAMLKARKVVIHE